MRQTIETVPKDGRPVVLEDERNGAFEVVHWSTEMGCWVGEQGESRMTPTHWYSLSPMHPLALAYQQTQSVSKRMGFGLFPRHRARPDRSAAPTCAVASGEVAVAPVKSTGPLIALIEVKRESAAWRRLLSIVGSTAGWFRGAIVSILFRVKLARSPQKVITAVILAVRRKSKNQRIVYTFAAIAAILIGAALVGLELPLELLHRGLNKNIAEVSAVTAVERAQSTLDQVSSAPYQHSRQQLVASSSGAAQEPAGVIQKRAEGSPDVASVQSSLQNEIAGTESLTVELDEARRKVEANAALFDKVVAEAAWLKHALESEIANLRESLQQERARAEALTVELEMARRKMEANAAPQVSKVPMPLSRPLSPAGVSRQSGGSMRQARSAVPRSSQAAGRSDRLVRKTRGAPKSKTRGAPKSATGIPRSTSISNTY